MPATTPVAALPRSLFVDSVAPTAPTITLVNDDVGSITGNVANNNGITDDTRPTISGTGEPGSLVSLYDNGILLTTVLIGTSGSSELRCRS